MSRRATGMTILETVIALGLLGLCIALFAHLIEGYLRVGQLSLEKGLLASRLQSLELIRSEVQLAQRLQLEEPNAGVYAVLKLWRADPRSQPFPSASQLWQPFASDSALEVIYQQNDRSELVRQVSGVGGPTVVAQGLEGISFFRPTPKKLDIVANFVHTGPVRKEIYLWLELNQ